MGRRDSKHSQGRTRRVGSLRLGKHGRVRMGRAASKCGRAALGQLDRRGSQDKRDRTGRAGSKCRRDKDRMASRCRLGRRRMGLVGSMGWVGCRLGWMGLGAVGVGLGGRSSRWVGRRPLRVDSCRQWVAGSRRAVRRKAVSRRLVRRVGCRRSVVCRVGGRWSGMGLWMKGLLTPSTA